MYSKAFMKFLFEYQKDDFKKDEEPKKKALWNVKFDSFLKQ